MPPEQNDTPGREPGHRWPILLEGDLAGRHDERLTEIAAQLGSLVEKYLGGDLPADSPPEAMHLRNPVVGGGAAGIALFFAYLAQARPGQGYDSLADLALETALTAVAETAMSPTLFGGFTGVAWAVSHLEGRFGEPEAEDPVAEIDPVLLEFLATSPWRGDYDLISGLVGYGTFAAERLPRPAAVACLERVIDRLNEIAERGPDGITWFTRPELVPPNQREMFPDGYYNLGLAHGVPGIITLLGTAVAAGVSAARAGELLDGAVRWLLSQQLPVDSSSRFATMAFPGIEPRPSRLAWCYGDAGIMASLVFAARCAGEPTWEEFALELARQAAGRDSDTCGVLDAPLCHGAAGLAHIFTRLFHATGEENLGAAARLWFEKTLGLRRPGQGIAGYQAWEDEGWQTNPGLLTGAAGIGLAFLGATTSIAPDWDRLLLVSVPPRLNPSQGD